MNKVFTAKEAEAWLLQGKSPADIPAGAVVTPSARDVFRNAAKSPEASIKRRSEPVPENPRLADPVYRWESGKDPVTESEIQAFFSSAAIELLKERMCDIGRRVWQRAYVDGNGGNLTIRVGDNLVLCTPTLISKGFMQPEDICLVDLDGNQKAGLRKRTSEVNTHIAIMKANPEARACVHAHPMYATAFAVAGVKPPTCLIPEPEIFLGEIALSRYETPGTAENARAVAEVAVNHQSVLMQNHGVIVWGKDIEDAYWKMENTESYCRTVHIASQLGKGMNNIGADKLKELIAIRQQLGMADSRDQFKECELCDNSEFQPGVICVNHSNCSCDEDGTSGKNPPLSGEHAEAEALVNKITDIIMQKL